MDRTYPAIKLDGPHNERNPDHGTKLIAQLKAIPRTAENIRLEVDTPSDTEWRMLGEHFTNVKYLDSSTGWNEELNDENMPLHWPLQRYILSDACGEDFRSPMVLQGRIHHLVLLLTSGLRFGSSVADFGPTSYEDSLESEAEGVDLNADGGSEEDIQTQTILLPDLVKKWTATQDSKEKTAGTDNTHNSGKEPPLNINLKKLEILENNAMDTFSRFTLALPHISMNLEMLNLRSTLGNDFSYTWEETFVGILPQLTNLKTLILTIGDCCDKGSYLGTLYKRFPPNLETLRFRGPAQLSQIDVWQNWIKSFGDDNFLPKLKALSFVLDMNFDRLPDNFESQKKKHKTPKDLLRHAKVECSWLWNAAKQRGIVVKPFREQWIEPSSVFKPVDSRWDNL